MLNRPMSTSATSLFPTMPPPGQQHQSQPPPPITVPEILMRDVHIPPDHVFSTPVKRINDQASLNVWMGSVALVRLLLFCQKINDAVIGKRLSDPCPLNETGQKILDVLGELDAWIDEIPPQESPQRFGNKSFRTWIDRLESNAERFTLSIYPARPQAVPELVAYLTSSFGNATRIDYGSGHELSFLAFLTCLDLLDAFTPEDRQALVTRVFANYLAVVRRLQTVYMLEPAGSHGVWGLDDHQHLPYLFGSAQLIGHPHIKPRSALNPDIVEGFAKEYLYLGAIAFIMSVKKGPFHEHSPILYDITAVPHWKKVNGGMMKMWVAEVLAKLPVVQHLPFGSLLPYDERADGDDGGGGGSSEAARIPE
ncbi:hypothetical protein BDZ88DRAFT_432664 [Geranomyces variabilis]|nr:hypothetical protein BDZ88DRAFT_432664 [Geranomyces variabilis]